MILKQDMLNTIEGLFTSRMGQGETLTSTTMMVDLRKPRSLDNSSIQQGCFRAWTWKSTKAPIFTQSLSHTMRMDRGETTTSKLTTEALDHRRTSISLQSQDLLSKKVWETTTKFHFILKEEVSWDRETTLYKEIYKKQARFQLKTLWKQWLKNKANYVKTWTEERQEICSIIPREILEVLILLRKSDTIANIILQRLQIWLYWKIIQALVIWLK